MAILTISLSEEQQQIVASLLSSGRFPDAGEVVSAGLRTLERQQREYDRKLAALRAAIDEGDASGFTEDSAAVFAEARARILERAKKVAQEQ